MGGSYVCLANYCISSSSDSNKKHQYVMEVVMRKKIEQLRKRGQGLVEYALILVLIAVVVLLILSFVGTKVNQTFSKIGSGLG